TAVARLIQGGPHLRNCSTYERSSAIEESEMTRKTRTSLPVGRLRAVSESVITSVAERSPFLQPRSRVSRKLSESGSSPAAISTVREERRNSGQWETTTVIASGEGFF